MDASRVVGLSGPIAVGKTTLSRLLGDGGWIVLDVRRYLANTMRVDLARDREALARRGDELSRSTQGQWMLDAIIAVSGERLGVPVVIDAVRRRMELSALRSHFGGALTHAYLEARTGVLEQRYHDREGDFLYERTPYHVAVASSAERELPRLKALADFTLDTSDIPADAVAARILES